MVSGDECSNTAIAEIKAGGPQKVCIGRDFTWESWAAMDELNRQFASPGSAPGRRGPRLRHRGRDPQPAVR